MYVCKQGCADAHRCLHFTYCDDSCVRCHQLHGLVQRRRLIGMKSVARTNFPSSYLYTNTTHTYHDINSSSQQLITLPNKHRSKLQFTSYEARPVKCRRSALYESKYSGPCWRINRQTRLAISLVETRAEFLHGLVGGAEIRIRQGKREELELESVHGSIHPWWNRGVVWFVGGVRCVCGDGGDVRARSCHVVW